jgi:predicted DNA-binding WGR domain protein
LRSRFCMRKKKIDDIEFLDGAFPIDARSVKYSLRAAGGFDAVILSPAQGMKESLDGARVAPVHGRVGHRGDGQKEIEGQPGDQDARNAQHRFPFRQQALGFHDQPDAVADRPQTHQVKDDKNRGVIERSGRPVGFQDQSEKIAKAVAQEQIAAQLGIDEDDSEFDAHGRHHQALMVVGANGEGKKGQVQIAVLGGRVYPAHQEAEHARHG